MKRPNWKKGMQVYDLVNYPNELMIVDKIWPDAQKIEVKVDGDLVRYNMDGTRLTGWSNDNLIPTLSVTPYKIVLKGFEVPKLLIHI